MKPVIIGAGLAGLLTAIEMAPRPCLVLSAGPLGEQTSTGWAQGGVAAAVGDDDQPSQHLADTRNAGAGLCDELASARIINAAPVAIDRLIALGAAFDRDVAGHLRLGLEGAHNRRRIVHAGDHTGAELLRTVTAAAMKLPSIEIWANSMAVRLVTVNGQIVGVSVRRPEGLVTIAASQVILATGGLGGLYAHTTNPVGSRGIGLALAARAGAVLRDLEMVQFHPTALAVNVDPMPLVSEAVRGEGAFLVDETGQPIIDNPLAARDVVARAEWAALQAGRKVFLDARQVLGFEQRFASITEKCLAAGLDPSRDLLPVRPAAHYHMGGVLVDESGQTSVPGLWCVGEVASTGLHGANRLASNSLLEALVCAPVVAAAVNNASERPITRGTPTPTPPGHIDLARIRHLVETNLGVLRDEAGLRQAKHVLAQQLHHDAALVGYLIAKSALARRESRGAHTRTDYPNPNPTAVHTLVDLHADLAVA